MLSPLTKRLLEGDSASPLKALVAADQKARREYQSLLKSYPSWEQARDAWVEEHGVPTDDLFGDKERFPVVKTYLQKMEWDLSEDDWHDLWLLAQHFDWDREFQRVVLSGIKKNLGTDCDEYRYLYDRISCGCTGTQRYGTQDQCDKD